MAAARSGLAAPTFKPLSKRQIDQRIERLVSELLSAELEGGAGDASERLRPRLISPAELIRRVAPFLSRN